MRLLIVACVALAGCASSATVPSQGCEVYHFHSSFPDAWKPAVRQGVALWAMHLPVRMDESASPGDTKCAFQATADPLPHNVEGLLFTTHEICSKVIGADCLAYEAAHAIGHQMGLGHIEDVGVMNPYFILPIITDADITECKRAGRCQ